MTALKPIDTHISVQSADFEMQAEYQCLLADNPQDGAVVTFVGLVRDVNQGQAVRGLFLEHYPGMTEKTLQDICLQARERWALGRIRIIHRVGKLKLADQIVFVGVTAAHRKAAFAGAEFIMDFLKTRAPFWKKESSERGEYWVAAKDSDKEAADRW